MHVETATASRGFVGPAGAEHYITVEAPPGGDFAAQLDALIQRYDDALAALGLGRETAVFRRVFVSDILNQAPLVRASRLANDEACPVALSLLRQPPLPATKLALLAYHVSGGAPFTRRRLSPAHIALSRNNLTHLWSTNLRADSDGQMSAWEQTGSVFAALVAELADQRGTLAANCVRTWLFMKDVDVFYQDLVDCRAAIFDREGLTRDSHYIASTGIEGGSEGRHDVISLDAYSLLGLDPRQISYLNDFDHLCPTADYGVTFERGTRLAFADRAQHFISGTASIDGVGRVVHLGNVVRQAHCALDNVDALLKSGGASERDLMHLTVYLRDAADYAAVSAELRERLPGLPLIFVQAPVCRPEWLVEVEGIAIAHLDAPELPGF